MKKKEVFCQNAESDTDAAFLPHPAKEKTALCRIPAKVAEVYIKTAKNSYGNPKST